MYSVLYHTPRVQPTCPGAPPARPPPPGSSCLLPPEAHLPPPTAPADKTRRQYQKNTKHGQKKQFADQECAACLQLLPLLPPWPVQCQEAGVHPDQAVGEAQQEGHYLASLHHLDKYVMDTIKLLPWTWSWQAMIIENNCPPAV